MLKFMPKKDKELLVVHSQFHGSWCPGDESNQGKSCHCIDLVRPKYSAGCTERVDIDQEAGFILGFLAQSAVWGISLESLFIRPFEKRDVLCRGNVRPSVRLSVRPSVRPSVRVFRTFLQHALRYQFETWYIHSVGGTTCRVWVASQLGHFDLVYSQK